MDKQFLLERDALNGKEGIAFATIDGEVHQIFSFINFQFKATFNEVPMKVVGTRKIQKKTTGIEFGGSFTVYMGSPYWAEIADKYSKTGQSTYFEMQLTIDDPNTTVGKLTVVIRKCKVTEMDLMKLDANADFLDQAVSFTALDFDILENFKMPDEIGGNQ